MPQEPGVVSFPQGTVEGLLNGGEMEIVSSEQEKIKEARAREIMGGEFFGADEVSKGLNIEIDRENLPQIQFTEEELRRAKELGHRLVLRVSQTKDGTPLTMQFLNNHMQPDFTALNNGDILWSGTDWYKDDPFFTLDVPEARWSLVSNEVIPDSTGRNYLQQTEVIANYLRNEVYGATRGVLLPKKYADAIAEFEEQKAEIEALIAQSDDASQIEVAKLLTELKLTILTRATPVDTLYDQVAYFKKTDTRLLEDTYTWTSMRSADGGIVMLGDFDSNGMAVGRGWPSRTASYLGVCISL